MAAEVRPLPPLRRPPGPAPVTADQTYWKTFKNEIALPSPHNTAITSVQVPDHNPTGPQADSFAVTSGGRVQIYSIKTRKLVKTISRFGVDDTARSGVLRRDGKILLAGGDSGVIQAFDTASRAILRQWKGEHAHKQPVHVVRWSPTTLTDLMSASDDRTLRIWNLTENAPKWIATGHQDYVRCASYVTGQESIVVSGSYDRTVRLWDTRQPGAGSPVMTFDFQSPVEDVLTLGPTKIAGAAGNEVKIVDLAAGKVEHTIRAHQKTVTALSTAQQGSRILTAALDGHVKMSDTSSWEVVASMKYSSPVLSLAVVSSGAPRDREDRHLAVGMQTGVLSIRTRIIGAEKVKMREKEKKMEALVAGQADEYERKQKKKDLRQGIRARDRGKDYRGEDADIVITGNDRSRQSRKKLEPWQAHLRNARYREALDAVLVSQRSDSGMRQETSLTLINALRHRSALKAAFANRNESQLLPIMIWCNRVIREPQHIALVYDALLMILHLYIHKFPEWETDDGDGKRVVDLVDSIKKRVDEGFELAKKAHSMLGVVEMLQAG